MHYGNANKFVRNCTLCGQSVDKHRIKIESNPRTDKLARQMQDSLDRLAIQAKMKGFVQAKEETTMVGAAIATINGIEYTFATISGRDVDALRYMSTEMMGAKVKLVKDVYHVKDIDAKISTAKLATIGGNAHVVTTALRDIGDGNAPPGACCAPKLLMAIFRKRAELKGKITAIRMSEIYWKNTVNGMQEKSRWSTAEAVHSCDNCKKLLPMMMCDHAD